MAKNSQSKKRRRSELQSSSLDALVRARQSANRKMTTYITGMQAAENDARSSDARWNEKWADYWKGRRDGLREAITMIGPNAKLTDSAATGVPESKL